MNIKDNQATRDERPMSLHSTLQSCSFSILKPTFKYLQPPQRRGTKMHSQSETDTSSPQVHLLHSGGDSGPPGGQDCVSRHRRPGGCPAGALTRLQTDRLDQCSRAARVASGSGGIRQVTVSERSVERLRARRRRRRRCRCCCCVER